MKQLIKIEFERAFKNKMFYISIIIGFVFMALHIYKYVIPYRPSTLLDLMTQYPEKMSTVQQPGLFMNWIDVYGREYSMVFHFILPILAALPYSMSIYLDVKKNYINNIAVRIEKKKYYMSKLITQFVVGGSVVTIPLAVSFIVTAMILPSIKPEACAGMYVLGNTSLFSYIFYFYPILFIVVLLIIDFIGFGLINCIAFVLAGIADNKFIVVLAPFILYFFDFVISSAFGKAPFSDMLTIRILRIVDLKYFIMYFILLILLSSISYFIRSRKKDIL